MAKSNAISRYIMATWRHWSVSLGLVALLVMLSPVLSRHFLPYVSFSFAAMLAVMIYNRRGRSAQGLAIPYIVTVSLVAMGVIMTAFNITVRITDVYELAGVPVNDELPYIVVLSGAPVMACVSGAFILRRLGRGRFFRTGSGRSDVSLVQRMVWQETRYQTRLLFWLSLSVTIAVWCYTFFSFTSVSLNKPDRFFFIWMPVIVYILSLVYLGFRCFSLWAFYSQNDPEMLVSPHRSTILRYIIIAGDSLYLSDHTLDVVRGMDSYLDTPVRLRVPYTASENADDARQRFMSYTGIDSGIRLIRFLFDGLGHSIDSNVFHYLCVLDDKTSVEGSRIASGQWFTLDELRRMDYSHRLSAEFSAEMVHIYTVAMAWKTYDIDGNRRYEFRNYRPTYRLCDIARWDVDYNDERWLRVSRLNADKPFFRLRRFFSRLTSPSVQ